MQQTMMVARALQAPFLTVTFSYWMRSQIVEIEVFFLLLLVAVLKFSPGSPYSS